MNKRWKVHSGETNFGKDPSEIHKKVVFPIIGTIIAKRSSASFVRTIFCRCFRVLVCHVIQFNCDVTLRPRFNAYLAFQC